MTEHIITVPKYKSKSRNIMRMLLKMDECFKYYDAVVVIRDTDCPHSEITEYLSTFHNVDDYNIFKAEPVTYVSRKNCISPDFKMKLTFGDTDTELPLVEVNSDEDKITDTDAEDKPTIEENYLPSKSKTRQTMVKINDAFMRIDSWKILEENGCCSVSVGVGVDDEIDLNYVKENISHSGVRHKCLTVDMFRTVNRASVVAVLTWKD